MINSTVQTRTSLDNELIFIVKINHQYKHWDRQNISDIGIDDELIIRVEGTHCIASSC